MLKALKTVEHNTVIVHTFIHKKTILLFSIVIRSSIFIVTGEIDQLSRNTLKYRASVYIAVQ